VGNPPVSPPKYLGDMCSTSDGRTWVALGKGGGASLRWVPIGDTAPAPRVVKPVPGFPNLPPVSGGFTDEYPVIDDIEDDDLCALAQDMAILLQDFSALAPEFQARKLADLLKDLHWRPTYEAEGVLIKLKRENDELKRQLAEALEAPTEAPEPPFGIFQRRVENI
jgi:hypothetical protein